MDLKVVWSYCYRCHNNTEFIVGVSMAGREWRECSICGVNSVSENGITIHG